MSFIGYTHDNDETLAYFAESVTQSEKAMVSRHDGVVYYWLTKRDEFLKLALRIFVVLASLSSNESDFSQLKIAVAKHR